MKHQIAALVGGNFAGFSGIKMVLPGASGNQLASLGFFYPFGGSLVSFYFRHRGIK